MAQRSYELFQHNKGSFMKIVSINLEGTDKLVSANLKHPDKETHGVAFNLDRPLSPDAKEQLKLGNFISTTVEDSGLCLIVTTKGGSVGSNTVEMINEKLYSIEKDIEKKEQDFLQKRKEALESIAKNIKLDFDKPLESLQR
jgi:hypothetical protein